MTTGPAANLARMQVRLCIIQLYRANAHRWRDYVLGRSGDLNAMMDHIDYLVKKFGAEHVAIGTDIAYMPRSADAEYRKMGCRPKSRSRYEALWRPARWTAS